MLQWGQELLLPDFSMLVRQLCSSRSQVKSVINILDNIPQSANKLEPETLNLVVQAYSKKGLLCKAKALLDEMVEKKIQINNETYTAMLLPLLKKGNMKDLNYYWNNACRNQWLPGLAEFKQLLVSICHWKMLGKALQLLEVMLLSYPSIRLDICHVFLEVLSTTGLSNVALLVLEELQHCFVLDHASYNKLIRGFCNEGKFSLAFTLLDDMLDKSLHPCLDVSVLLIPQLCNADRHEKAIALKDIIVKEQPSFSHDVHCALIHGFCKMGNLWKADTLFQDMLFNGLILDGKLCNILIQGHCYANDLRKVDELLGAAIRKNWELSHSSYKHLVRLMCMKGRVHFALSLKNLILAQCPLDDLIIYNILVFYLLSVGNSLIVNNIVTEMEEKKIILDEVSYDFLVYGFWQCKDLSSALHYLTTMISKGRKPSKRSLRKVISSLCEAGELQKALELSHEMRLRGWVHDSVTQTAITESFLSHGKIQEAEMFLDQMEAESLTPDNINYDYLINLFCQNGRLNKAVHLVNIMLKKSNIPSSICYDSIIRGFCAQKKLNDALDLYSEMLNLSLIPRINTLEMLVDSFCQDGRTEQAERFLLAMVHRGETPTREMYCTVIKGYRTEKNLSKASDLMQAMQDSGYQPDFETHWSLISNLSNIKAKDSDNSKGFLSRLLSKSGFLKKK
ncbi:hypothetical protein PIB30_020338 [Stylosanthes scabra]|uniref:Pentatricopeptide repeat-containing protein n=1 Tax=Stylosanthes scabra TaxID=79078 RepID=A0ABU6Y5R1_9FABA|nr:hypothetical protein [Stylosanthes scabra]